MATVPSFRPDTSGLDTDPGVIGGVGEYRINIPVKIRSFPGVRISLRKSLVNTVQYGHHMDHMRRILWWRGDDPRASLRVPRALIRFRFDVLARA